VLDRAFSGSDARWHLFGLKSQAIAVAAQHLGVASSDGQAYGIAARQDAREARASKSDAMVATTMTHWHKQQLAAISARLTLPPSQTWASPPDTAPKSAIEARTAAAMEYLRERHEYGEIDRIDVSPQAAYEMAFLDD
jgi:hypothetical protein